MAVEIPNLDEHPARGVALQGRAAWRAGHTALAIAEEFRNTQHEDVLLLDDNVFRLVQAGCEVSGLLDRLPSRVGYQPKSSVRTA